MQNFTSKNTSVNHKKSLTLSIISTGNNSKEGGVLIMVLEN